MNPKIENDSLTCRFAINLNPKKKVFYKFPMPIKIKKQIDINWFKNDR